MAAVTAAGVAVLAPALAVLLWTFLRGGAMPDAARLALQMLALAIAALAALYATGLTR